MSDENEWAERVCVRDRFREMDDEALLDALRQITMEFTVAQNSELEREALSRVFANIVIIKEKP